MNDYANLLGDGSSVPVIVPSSNAVAVPEGGTAQVGVTLSRAPAVAVNVTVAKAAGGDVNLTASTASLSFTATNWNVPQSVVFAASEDADQLNGSALFSLSSAGLTTVNLTATEIDNDVMTPVTLVVTGAPLTVPEGGSRAFQVKLSAAPTGNVVVSVARSAGDTDLSVSAGASLTFTPSDWNTARSVTVAAAEDADTANGSATFTVSAANAASVSVSATEQDNDGLGAACTVNFDTSNDWGSGQVPRVVLQNTGTSAITGWTLSWTASNDLALSNSWGATAAQSGRNLSATPTGWNATIPASGTVEFGMQFSYSGAKPVPTNLRWEGRDCTVVVK